MIKLQRNAGIRSEKRELVLEWNMGDLQANRKLIKVLYAGRSAWCAA
jgi:hypothetical protein